MSKAVNWLKSNILLLMILLLALALRLYHINFQSLWLDEIHTVNEANPALTLKELYELLCYADPHPPLYFLLAKGAFILFGYTDITLRILSVVIGISGVWSIYLLGKELYTKQAGLIGATLIAVNQFHIYYSQDARPYPLLFLCTVLSFYFLLKFIKSPSLRSAVLYGIFTGLMLYSHLFSLFALCSQCVILLYFILKPYGNVVTARKMFVQCLISGAVIIILYLPCLGIFISAAARTSFWIEKPKPDVYIDLISEFFGNYDILLLFVIVALVYFFIGIAKENRKKVSPPLLKVGGILLLSWLLITLLIPLLKSYIGVSIIISRYFINVLPAVILLVAIGITQIKNKLVIYGVTTSMVVLSLYNIFIVKQYYTTINKTQFREATAFIAKNNIDNSPVVSSLGWYMPFYFNMYSKPYPVYNKSLEEITTIMGNDASRIKSFWYIDAHIRPYNPSEKAKQFLESNFEVDKSYEGYDVWTKHYIPLKDIKTEITSFGNLNTGNGDQINYYVENFEKKDNIVTIGGWALLSDIDASKSKIKVCLVKDRKANTLPTLMADRIDVTNNLKLQYNANNSGFLCTYNIDMLKPGKYQLGIYMENKEHNKSGLVITDKFFIKNGL